MSNREKTFIADTEAKLSEALDKARKDGAVTDVVDLGRRPKASDYDKPPRTTRPGQTPKAHRAAIKAEHDAAAARLAPPAASTNTAPPPAAAPDTD